jgi:mannose-6-phosphate isomerase-like protein (cupin superfamily)
MPTAILPQLLTMVLSQAAASATAPAAPAPATPAPAAIVTAETVDATMRASIANNTLDTKMNETPVKGGIVRVGLVHRTKPEPRALLHDDLTEIYQIIKGSGTLFTGGTPQEPTSVSDPPNLGPTPSWYVTQSGGVTRKVKPNDIVIIPAGLPHRFSELDGPIEYVIYRFEAGRK